ncbi:1-acyl-sn-glycerol-3-phosphate acyltransferase [Agromyces flavus]|nr:lysophospholipid acyltransferase family protein [Agromyces flavus]MCP2366232.1 1-acyl-sn-glycerol-3-phosphate acyltransferase [Agromyces flavus]
MTGVTTVLGTASLHLPAPPTARQVRRSGLVSYWRSKLWGLLLSIVTDGVTTIPAVGGEPVPLARKPPVPDGPLVVIANHASHADTAVLLATIGRSRPVRFVAAADYWFGRRRNKLIARWLVGIWPIRRDRNGMKDLLAAAPTVAAGVVVVVFPEGSRRHAPGLAGFKRGAFELAAASGAKVLPVGLVGAGDLLPVDRKLIRRRPVEMRWGEPFTVETGHADDAAAAAFGAIDRLIEAPASQRPGRAWIRVRRMAFATAGLALVTAWAFAEGIFWPLVAEMPLLLLVCTVGRSWRGPMLIAATAIASAAGILTTWWLVSHGVDTPTPLTTARMHDTAVDELRTDPSSAFANQMFNGIPVKVYAHSAGQLGMDFFDVAFSMLPRLARIGIVGVIGWVAGGLLSRYLKPCLGTIQATFLTLFPLGLGLVIWWWS